MNLMGKIFTVAILLLSLIFLVLSVMVGATHRNWKDIANSNKQKANTTEDRLNDARANSVELQKAMEAEKVARRLQIAQMNSQTERDRLTLESQAEKVRQLGQTKDRIQAEFNIVNQRVQDQIQQIQRLQDANNGLIDDLADQHSSVVNLQNEINKLAGKLRLLEKSNESLTGQLASQLRVMKAHGISVNTPIEQVAQQLEGVVIEADDDIVVVSLGTDDGLRENHEIDIFRGERFIGKGVVVQANHNKAAARLTPEFKKSAIREGDYVTTKY